MRTDPVFNVTFVSIVERHPCLYASSSPDYNNRSVQEKAWEAVANEVHESVTECKERWKNIRGCYTRYLKSLSTGGGKKQPYYLADSLHFLTKYTKSRSRGEYQEYREFPNLEPSVTLEEDDATSSSQDVGGYEAGSPDVKPNPADLLQPGTMSFESEFVSPVAQKRFRLYRDSSSVDEPNKQAVEYQYSKELQDEKKRENADLAFLTSLLYDMKDMTRTQKRKFKIGILNLAGQILNEPDLPDTSATREDSGQDDPVGTPASSSSSFSAVKISSNFVEKNSEN